MPPGRSIRDALPALLDVEWRPPPKPRAAPKAKALPLADAASARALMDGEEDEMWEISVEALLEEGQEPPPDEEEEQASGTALLSAEERALGEGLLRDQLARSRNTSDGSTVGPKLVVPTLSVYGCLRPFI